MLRLQGVRISTNDVVWDDEKAGERVFSSVKDRHLRS